MEELYFLSKKDLYILEHTKTGKSRRLEKITAKQRRKMIYENMHLMEGMTFTNKNQFPQLAPYSGSVDFESIPYTERNKHNGINQALHFFLDDYRFRNAVWCNLEYTTYSIRNYDYLFTPDLSLWVDLPTDFYNKENLYRTRFIGAYWQKCGYNVIPTASWGNIDSFQYCFEGLPENSVIAVSGIGHHHCASIKKVMAVCSSRIGKTEKADITSHIWRRRRHARVVYAEKIYSLFHIKKI